MQQQPTKGEKEERKWKGKGRGKAEEMGESLTKQTQQMCFDAHKGQILQQDSGQDKSCERN